MGMTAVVTVKVGLRERRSVVKRRDLQGNEKPQAVQILLSRLETRVVLPVVPPSPR